MMNNLIKKPSKEQIIGGRDERSRKIFAKHDKDKKERQDRDLYNKIDRVERDNRRYEFLRKRKSKSKSIKLFLFIYYNL